MGRSINIRYYYYYYYFWSVKVKSVDPILSPPPLLPPSTSCAGASEEDDKGAGELREVCVLEPVTRPPSYWARLQVTDGR